jgi:MFS family permease
MAPGLLDVALKYDITNPTMVALTFSIFLMSFAIGPLFLAPLSEMYGRAWVRGALLRNQLNLFDPFKVLHSGNVFFLGFNLGCALSPNAITFIVFRFLGMP